MIYDEAVVYTLTGRTGEALKSLREALQRGYSIQEVQKDPELATLQSRPEFARLVAEFSKSNKSK
jgi:hypothetical protein